MVRNADLKGHYDFDKTIGCGGFAKVKLATHLLTGEKVAIKIMSKSALGNDLPRVQLEIQALQDLCHQNICKLYQVIETSDFYYLVMEYCSGGELFDHIIEKSRLSEQESRIFFRQILSAVGYLHSNGYAHRDLKPENILLDSDQNLKLIDFGLCAQPKGGMLNILHTACGSPTYAAPELVLAKEYLGSEVDVWAAGVLLFVLLAGYLPFDDQNISSLYEKIKIGVYKEPYWMSKSSKDLIKSMLQVDPKKRINLSQLLKHPWVTAGDINSVSFRSKEDKSVIDDDCVEVMSRYYQQSDSDIKTRLQRWKYDYETATYLLLKQKKTKQQPLILYQHSSEMQIPPNVDTPKSSRNQIEGNPIKRILYEHNKNMQINKTLSVEKKSQKRARVSSEDDDNEPPVKSPKMIGNDLKSPKSNKFKRLEVSTCSTPKSTSKRSNMLGTLERSFNHVRQILTPNKRLNNNLNLKPQTLTEKELCNVSTTLFNDPECLVVELIKSLEKRGVNCTRKGFRIRGKVNSMICQSFGSCSFELEVCLIPHIFNNQPTNSTGKTNNLRTSLGIKRKRLRGNAWSYKRVCEQVLALTACEFQNFETTV